MIHRKPTKKIDKNRMLKAVASSSAIETGESISQIEHKLKSATNKFHSLELAK